MSELVLEVLLVVFMVSIVARNVALVFFVLYLLEGEDDETTD